MQVDTTVPLHHSTPEDGIIGSGKEDNVSNAGSAHSAAAAEDKTAAAAASAANQSGSANQGGGRRSTASGSAELKTTWCVQCSTYDRIFPRKWTYFA